MQIHEVYLLGLPTSTVQKAWEHFTKKEMPEAVDASGISIANNYLLRVTGRKTVMQYLVIRPLGIASS